MGYDIVEGKVRKRVRRCYLGPEDKYRYVTMLHTREGLVLRGLVEDRRWFEYLGALLEYIYSGKAKISHKEALQIAELLRLYSEKLKRKYSEENI